LFLWLFKSCRKADKNPPFRAQSQHRTLNQFLNKTVVSSNTRPGPPPSQHGPQNAQNQATAAPPPSGTPGAAPAPPAPSAPPPAGAGAKPRIPLQYVHTRELDRFYELPHAQLPAIPPSVRASMNQRHRCKVRVTHNQKTGEELARIIKIRVADLDVYSPRTAFDWRISVNLEMPFDGDVAGLPEASEASGGKGSKRSKDRMTYKHLAYQIDLTQVILQVDVGFFSLFSFFTHFPILFFLHILLFALSLDYHEGADKESRGRGRERCPSKRNPSQHSKGCRSLTLSNLQSSTGKAEKEHELEVEVSAAKVRELGQLAKQGQADPYTDLIRGFVDNVRILARAISPA
jgi:hypothetical protein